MVSRDQKYNYLFHNIFIILNFLRFSFSAISLRIGFRVLILFYSLQASLSLKTLEITFIFLCPQIKTLFNCFFHLECLWYPNQNFFCDSFVTWLENLRGCASSFLTLDPDVYGSNSDIMFNLYYFTFSLKNTNIPWLRITGKYFTITPSGSCCLCRYGGHSQLRN